MALMAGCMYIAFENDQQTNSVPIHGSLVIWVRVLSKSFEIELLNREISVRSLSRLNS